MLFSKDGSASPPYHGRMRMTLLACLLLALDAEAAGAQAVDKYHLTAEEKAACTGDAVRLCADAYPDEDKLLACMNANRGSLTAGCAAVFQAGLKERHLR